MCGFVRSLLRSAAPREVAARAISRLAMAQSASSLVPSRVAGLDKPSVWLEFSPLAQARKAINLGQGFPDWPPPSFVTDAGVQALQDASTQRYGPSRGHPALLEAIAKQYSKRLGRSLDPQTDAVVTVGASQGLFLAMQAFLEEGDEVLVIEPAFDLYLSSIAMAKATAKCIPLRSHTNKPLSSSELYLDMGEFEEALTEKTRMLILNSPHNPTGKMFTAAEYSAIAAVLQKYPNCLVISDEVYEHIVFDGRKHVPFASVDGMWDRTMSLYSAGKTFSVTGWKIGWTVGPSHLIQRLVNVQQAALANALNQASQPFEGFPTYYAWLAEEYRRKRQILLPILEKASLCPSVPEGGFFIMCSTLEVEDFENEFPDEEHELILSRRVEVDNDTLEHRDYNFCRWLTFKRGVTAIPPSAFFTAEHADLGHDTVRFAFCKTDEVLIEAGRRLLEAN